MFRKKEVFIIRERRRMSSVQVLATAVALLGLVVATPHLIEAAKLDFATAQAQTAEPAADQWCTPARVQAGLCAPSLFDPNRMVRLASTGDCRRENGNLICKICKPDNEGKALVCHTERQ